MAAAAGIELPEYPSTEWEKIYAQWITAFIGTLAELGLDYSDWMFVLADEASEHHLLTWEIPVGKLIKEIDPQARITSNSSAVIRDEQAASRYFQVVDVFQPHLGLTPDPELYDWLKQSGKEIWFYRCSFSGNLYDDYRVFVWETLKYGGTGTGVWTYCSQGGRNYYDPSGENPGRYILIYPHPKKDNAVIATRRYSAFVDGLDDYRYVQALLQTGRDTGRTEQALKVVEKAVHEILSMRADRSTADKWRTQMADLIEQWQSAGPVSN